MFVLRSTYLAKCRECDNLHRINSLLTHLLQQNNAAVSQVELTTFAVAKLIGKLNPMYGVDELSPERKAESDAIGERVIAQLRGEFAAIRESNQ
jgi:hypothetical protein